jgi:hypothetical protein
MSGGKEKHAQADSILTNKGFWIGVGLAIFVLIGFILPAPQSLIDALEEFGYVDRMIERVIHTIDFVKYGFLLWVLSMILLWTVGFLGIYPLIGFPEGILEAATRVLESGAQ